MKNAELRFFVLSRSLSGLMNYVMTPESWKQFIYQVGQTQTNTLQQNMDWWQEEKNVKKEGKQFSSS